MRSGRYDSAEMVDVTPALAERLLAHGRRINIKQYMVETLAQKMLAGEFTEEPDEVPIWIREDGKLRGGHHRLRAVVRSGVTVRLRVSGLDRL